MPLLGSAQQRVTVSIFIRVAVGAVFLSEGIQKFLFPQALGAGRFAQIGIPLPQFSAPVVGVVEIVCGSLLLVGVRLRLASVLLLVDILVAIATTKVPLLLNQGFWKMAHEARTDWAMLCGLLFLLTAGNGGARPLFGQADRKFWPKLPPR